MRWMSQRRTLREAKEADAMKNKGNGSLRHASETIIVGTISMMRFVPFFLAISLLLNCTLLASTSVLIAEEDFEGSMSCKLTSVGSFPVSPGIKIGMGAGGSRAYGFGRSSCGANAWDGYVNDLTFTFPRKCVITKVKFWEIERYDNWGSQGWLIANGVKIDDTTFGRLPSNDRIADSSFREKEFDINVVTSNLTFRCWDITNLSELFIDNIRIYGYIYEDVYTVAFNANGGIGDKIPLQGFSSDEPQKLYKNNFIKDGCVFQGWAKSVERATNRIVDYTDEQEITVDSDMTLYAVWANPAMTLTAESADWSSGSITLRCEDADTSNATHKYSLEYKNESGIWTNVNDEAAINIERSSDGFAHLTDNMFWSRLGGVSSVAYRVKDENGRISEMCVTRYRHGLFVAIDAYQNGWQTSLSGPEIPEIYTSTHLARSFRRAYEQQGKAHGYRCLLGTSGSLAWKKTILKQMDYIAEQVAAPGDVVLFYYCGHGDMGRLTCYGEEEYLYASDLSDVLQRSAAKGAGIVAIIDACRSASVITQSAIGGTENVGWIVASQANESSWDDYFAEAICYKGWINGFADRIEAYGNEDGIVTFGELALFGQEYMGDSYDKHGQIMSFWNSLVLDHMVAGRTPSQERISNQSTWLKQFTGLFTASSGDIAKVAAMTAANGRMTVSDCFDCGVNPEDPDDDFKITHFEMKDGKPIIEMNHTKDGSGNSFEDRVKILGKAELTDTEWQEVPPEGNPEHRFFKVGVEMP